MKHIHTREVNSNHKVIKERPYAPSQAPTNQSYHCVKVPSSQAPSRPVVVARIGRHGGACPTEVPIEPREGPRELEVREGSRGSLYESVVSTVVGGSEG